MLLLAEKRSVARPGRLPDALRPLGPTARLSAALGTLPLLLTWDRATEAAEFEGWSPRGSGEPQSSWGSRRGRLWTEVMPRGGHCS